MGKKRESSKPPRELTLKERVESIEKKLDQIIYLLQYQQQQQPNFDNQQITEMFSGNVKQPQNPFDSLP